MNTFVMLFLDLLFTISIYSLPLWIYKFIKNDEIPKKKAKIISITYGIIIYIILCVLYINLGYNDVPGIGPALLWSYVNYRVLIKPTNKKCKKIHTLIFFLKILIIILLCALFFIIGIALGSKITNTSSQNKIKNIQNNTSSQLPSQPFSTERRPTLEELIAERDNKNSKKSSQIVVTTYGTKYHLPYCQYVKNKTNIIELTEPEAISRGKKPCEVCIGE